MTAVLRREGHAVNRKRVRRLMRLMGLQSLAPGPDTSRAHPAHPVYPYLLRDTVVQRPNQVWATDITYIRIERGFAYLVAVMDWHSRKVLAWRLSNTLDTEFCVEALQEALRSFGPPEIFNTDQGQPVHQPRLYWRAAGPWDTHQHGRQGSGIRQHLRGAAVALRQV